VGIEPTAVLDTVAAEPSARQYQRRVRHPSTTQRGLDKPPAVSRQSLNGRVSEQSSPGSVPSRSVVIVIFSLTNAVMQSSQLKSTAIFLPVLDDWGGFTTTCSHP